MAEKAGDILGKGAMSSIAKPAELRDLVQRLDPLMARRLLTEMRMSTQPTSRAVAAQRAIVDRLNQRRPHRVQRLFTSYFEAFFGGDPNLLTAPAQVPGLLTRVDVAALWLTLANGIMAKLIPVIAREIDNSAHDLVIDEIIASESGQARRAEMLDLALAQVTKALRSPDDTLELQQALNRQRTHLLKQAAPRFGPLSALDFIRPLERADIALLRDLLVHGAEIEPEVRRALAAIPPDNAGPADLDRAVLVLETAQQALVQTLDSRNFVATALPVLVPLHARAAYEVTGRYLARRGFDANAPVVSDALFGHFAAALQGLLHGLSSLLPKSDAHSPAELARDPLTPNADLQSYLDQQLKQVGRIVDAIKIAGLVDQPEHRQAALFRPPWREFDELINQHACPILSGRIQAVAGQFDGETQDESLVIWLTGWVWRWRGILANLGQAPIGLLGWCDELGRQLDQHLAQPVQDGAGARKSAEETDRLRLRHMTRLRPIYQALGLEPDRAMNATNRGMMRSCQAAIERQLAHGEIPTEDEQHVIRSMVALIRDEVDKTRKRWIAADHADFAELARRAGY